MCDGQTDRRPVAAWCRRCRARCNPRSGSSFGPVLGHMPQRVPVSLELLDAPMAAALRARVALEALERELTIHGHVGDKLLLICRLIDAVRANAHHPPGSPKAKQAREDARVALTMCVVRSASAMLCCVLVDFQRLLRCRPRPAQWQPSPATSQAESSTSEDETLLSLAWKVRRETQSQASLAVIDTLLEHGANPCDSIHDAVSHNDFDCVRLLVRDGAPLKAKHPRLGGTPLHIAALGGQLEMCRMLLSLGASAAARSARNSTVLAFACRAPDKPEGILPVVQLLIELGVPVNAAGGEGHTPLHFAAQQGWLEVVRLLLQHGARVNKESKFSGVRPISVAISPKPHLDVMGLLLDNGAQFLTPDHAIQAVMAAFDRDGQCGQALVDTIRLLGKHNALRGALPIKWMRLVSIALRYDERTAAISALLDAGCPVDREGDVLEGPLHLAAMDQHHDVVALLLDRGASCDDPSSDDCTALGFAAAVGGVQMIQTLVKHGASLAFANGENGAPPLGLAAREAQAGACRELLALGADVNARDKTGATPLLAALCTKRDESSTGRDMELTVTTLLEAGADPNTSYPEDGMTALHGATIGGHSAIVRELLKHGADVDAVYNAGRRVKQHALDIAVAHDWPECVAALTAAGGTLRSRGRRAS